MLLTRNRLKSGLSSPGRLGDLAPASPNFIEIVFRQWPGCQHCGILGKSSRLRGSDNRRVHTGNAESKAEGGGDDRFEITFEERVFQLLQPFPINVSVEIIGRTAAVVPGDVGQRPF